MRSDHTFGWKGTFSRWLWEVYRSFFLSGCIRGSQFLFKTWMPDLLTKSKKLLSCSYNIIFYNKTLRPFQCENLVWWCFWIKTIDPYGLLGANIRSAIKRKKNSALCRFFSLSLHDEIGRPIRFELRSRAGSSCWEWWRSQCKQTEEEYSETGESGCRVLLIIGIY